jgi:indole-3-glycerol phosphate synthase
MNILDKIVEHKRREVASRKSLRPIKSLEQGMYFSRPTTSLKQHVQHPGKTGIIAEFKRKSPSKGMINQHALVDRTTTGYIHAGASALSVLTDTEFFGGSSEDLGIARKFNDCPILRKDFTIDEYQVVEAKAMGADAILLIAAILTLDQSRALAGLAHSLSLEVLLEVHDEDELKAHAEIGADLIGVNNRNLKTFEISIEVSKRLAPLMPPSVVKVSESGISDPNTIIELEQFGYEGFLMGENFMKHARPEESAVEFMNELRKLRTRSGSQVPRANS